MLNKSCEQQFFKFRCSNVDQDNSTWTIPTTVTENSDGITIASNWSKTSVQGSTEAMSAFNYVDNPGLNINLKFGEDLWREFNITDHTYEETIAKLASLQYPGERSGYLTAPYVIISYINVIYRGYFTNMKIVTYGPVRNGHRIFCDVSANFVVVKSKAPTRKEIASSFSTTFQ